MVRPHLCNPDLADMAQLIVSLKLQYKREACSHKLGDLFFVPVSCAEMSGRTVRCNCMLRAGAPSPKQDAPAKLCCRLHRHGGETAAAARDV